jgi:hypothetical protein
MSLLTSGVKPLHYPLHRRTGGVAERAAAPTKEQQGQQSRSLGVRVDRHEAATELIAVADFDQPGVVLRRSMPKDTRP